MLGSAKRNMHERQGDSSCSIPKHTVVNIPLKAQFSTMVLYIALLVDALKSGHSAQSGYNNTTALKSGHLIDQDTTSIRTPLNQDISLIRTL